MTHLHKVCFKCGDEKPLGSFYAHKAMADGHLGKCKECAKKDVSERYRQTRAERASYERERFRRPERKEKIKAYAQSSRLRDPVKYKARIATSNAIRDGRLTPKPCEVCGSEKTEAHHADYSKPLDVRWLCRIHHLAEHRKEAYALLCAEAET